MSETTKLVAPQLVTIEPNTRALLNATSDLTVRQQTSNIENIVNACCPGNFAEVQNKYEIYDSQGTYILLAKEDSNFCCRICCNPSHSLDLNIKETTKNQEALRIERPFR
ncbi:hypothetical protein CYMTET_27066, partial [Cymbomonas tetramitiformis]